MGNCNSGRWGNSGKPAIESCLKLDIRYLSRQSCFRPGTSGTGSLSWTRNGNPVSSIGYTFTPDQIILHYRNQDQDQDIHQLVKISRTPCHFGGSMVWFLCPRCGRRVNALYAGTHFYCRYCHRLGYGSQREGVLNRSLRKQRKIRARIGGSDNLCEPIPFRPKGMHWRTYWRIRESAARTSQGAASIMWKMMGR